MSANHFSPRNSSLLHPQLFRCSNSGPIPQLPPLRALFRRYALKDCIDYPSFQQIHAILIALPAMGNEAALSFIDTSHFMSTALFQACDVGRQGSLTLTQWIAGLVLLGYTWSDAILLKLRLLYEAFSGGDGKPMTGRELLGCIETCCCICYQTSVPSLIPRIDKSIDPSCEYSFAEFATEIEGIQVIIENIYGISEMDDEDDAPQPQPQ